MAAALRATSYGMGESEPEEGGEAETYGAAHGGHCGGLGAQRWPELDGGSVQWPEGEEVDADDADLPGSSDLA